MKIAPNPAAFTALSNTDFKKVPRQQARENKLVVPDGKLDAKLDQVKSDKKADSFRALQDAALARQQQKSAAEHRSREAPRPRPAAGHRLGQKVDIRV